MPSDRADVFEKALDIAESNIPKRAKAYEITSVVNRLREKADTSRDPIDMLASLFIQAPRASIAQRKMDENRHNYHDKNNRLFELIDFNDTFDLSVLLVNQNERKVFAVRAKEGCDEVCKRVQAPCFSNDQWESIIRGLGREIAIYLAAKNSGFDVYMTARTQDAIGIDMQIRDPASGRYINIDCKSHPSFRRRLEDLAHEGRLTDDEIVQADEVGYCITLNGPSNDRKEVVLLAVLADFYGEIENFEFVDVNPIREKLNEIIWRHGLTDNKYGALTKL